MVKPATRPTSVPLLHLMRMTIIIIIMMMWVSLSVIINKLDYCNMYETVSETCHEAGECPAAASDEDDYHHHHHHDVV